MTANKAKDRGYTHHGKLYGFSIYMTDDDDMNVIGTNWLNETMINIFIWFDVTFEINECFAVLKGDKL